MADFSTMWETKRSLSRLWLGPDSGHRRTSARSAVSAFTEAVRPEVNVHAVGIGPKMVQGETTGDMAIRVYVESKFAPAAIPDDMKLPSTINGFPTDIIEAPRARLASNPLATTRRRPLVAGSSVGHYRVTAGTLACFCRSTKPGEEGVILALSNNHVFAAMNLGQTGDAILQPGWRDGGAQPDDVFATLHRFEALEFAPAVNRLDAAVALVNSGTEVRAEILEIGAVTGSANAAYKQAVRKFGRTTGLTRGTVTDVAVDIAVDTNDGRTMTFDDQVFVASDGSGPVALPGDSGSLLVNDAGEAVALLFACPSDGSYALGAPIRLVEELLAIQLLTDDGSPKAA
ncbi:hypothetical protein [Azospirillum sp. B2RO_4]|uniref:hypothetical protein n=1 Tax=Azospirillum sp. B2RO_4 TaxID=3027796 RepID=UPI003DAA1990